MTSPVLTNVFSASWGDGGVVIEDRQRFKDYVSAKYGEGEVFELVVEDFDPARTYDQHKYIHAEPLPKFAKHFGLTIAQTKLVLLGEHYGWMPGAFCGQQVPVEASTSDLGKRKMTIWIDWLIQFGAEQGLNILPPEKDPAKRDKRVYVDEVAS